MRKHLQILLIMGAGSVLAQADTIYNFAFAGTVGCNNCFVGGPAELSTIQAGDPFTLSFQVDVNTATVENIDVNYFTRGVDINGGSGTTGFTWYTISSPYEYRWDFTLPGNAPFTYAFWLRTTQSGVVCNCVPQTIDPNQFNYLHDLDVYRNNGDGGPLVLDGSLNSSLTPEPSAATLSIGGLVLIGLAAIRRGRHAR